MSNYDRTMELVNAATDSAGASQKQYEKTMESLEAKLNKLSNAWDQFAMGIANDQIIKLAIDALTKVLEVVTAVTGALGNIPAVGGLLEAAADAAILFGALKAGSSILEKFSGKVIDLMPGMKTSKPDKPDTKPDTKKNRLNGFKAGEAFAKGYEEGKEKYAKKNTKEVKNSSLSNATNALKKYQQSLGDTTLSIKDLGQKSNEVFAEIKDDSGAIQIVASEFEQVFRNQIPKDVDKTAQSFKDLDMALAKLGNSNSLQDLNNNFGNVGTKGKLVKNSKGQGTNFTIDSNSINQMSMFEVKADGAVNAADGLGDALSTVGALAGDAGDGLGKAGGIISTVTGLISGLQAVVTGLSVALGISVAAVAGVVAALGALVAIVALAIYNSPENVLARELEAAEKAAEDAAKAVEQTKEAYDDLKNSLDRITNQENELDGLIKGTVEWKQAVFDLNQEVLALLDKYPDLATIGNGLVKNANGVYELNEAQQDYLLDTQEQAIKNSQIMLEGSQAYEKTVKLEKAKGDVRNNAIDQEELRDTSGGRIELFDDIIQNLLNQGIDLESAFNNTNAEAFNALEQAHKDELALIGLSEEDFGVTEIGEDLLAYGKEYARGLEEIELQKEGIGVYLSSLLDSATEEGLQQSDYYEGVNALIASSGIDTFQSDIENELKEIEKLSDDEIIDAYAKALKIDVETINDQIEDGSLELEQIKRNLASYNIGEELGDITEGLVSAIKTIGDDDLKKLFSEKSTFGELSDLTKVEAGGIKQDTIKKLAEATGFTETQIIQYLEDFVEQQHNELEKAQEIFQKFEGDILTDLDISTSSKSILAQQINSVFKTLGKEAATGVTDFVQNAVSGMGEDETQAFINAFNSLDLTNIDSVEGFSEALEGIGYSGSISGKNIDDLEQQIIALGIASKQVSLETLIDNMRSLANLSAELSEQEGLPSISQERYDELIAGGMKPEDFEYNALTDSFNYFGGTAEDLVNEIGVLLDKTYEENKQKYEDNITSAEAAQFAEVYRKNNSIKQIEDMDLTSLGNYITGYINNLNGAEGVQSLDYMTELLKTGSLDELQSLANAIQSESDNINNYIADLYNLENQGKLTALQTGTTQAAYQQTQTGTDEEKQLASRALEQKANAAGVTKRDVELLQKYNKEFAKNKDLARLTAIQQKTLQKNMDDNTDALNDYITALNDTEEGSEEYQKITSDISYMMENITGFEVPDDFFDMPENINLLKEALAGDDGSWDELYNKIAFNSQESFNQIIIGADQMSDELFGIISNLDGTSFSIDGYANLGQLVEQLLAAGYTAEKVAAHINSLEGTGIEAEVTYKEIEQTLFRPNGNEYTKTTRVPTIIYKGIGDLYNGTGFNDGGNFGGSGGGGGSDSEDEPWSNDYDKFYNLLEEINEEVRIRNKLESDYKDIVEDTNANAKDVINNLLLQEASLQRQTELQKELLSGREGEMADLISDNSKWTEYANYNQKEGYVEINWDKINTITDQDEGQEFQDYLTELEKLADDFDDINDTLDDIDDKLQEIAEVGKEDFESLEQSVLDAIINSRQKEIDALTSLNETLNNTNSNLLSEIQSSISDLRQDRDNAETESDLSDLEQRLAYLQQDTSGANAMEILSLQEQIAEGRQSYTDSLIDQKITQLQEQNDKAAAQRDLQIQLAQAQLDNEVETGALWNQVNSLLSTGITSLGTLIKGSELESLLKDSASWNGFSEIQKMNWLDELTNQIKMAVSYLASAKQLEDIGKTSGQIEFTNSKGEKLTGTINKDGSVSVNKDGGTYTYDDVYQSFDGSYASLEGDPKFSSNKPTSSNTTTTTTKPTVTKPSLTQGSYVEVKSGTKWYSDSYGGGSSGVAKNGTIKYTNTKGSHAYNIDGLGWIKKSDIVGYKTGGLADFTGPAWLDGTPSSPEMVLNSRDTQNFIQLKDTLSQILTSKKDGNAKSGDNYYQVDIKVEKIENDYDVEQMANKVKDIIHQNSIYRNVNSINLLR